MVLILIKYHNLGSKDNYVLQYSFSDIGFLHHLKYFII